MTKPVFLNPLKGKPKQFPFMAFDIETDPSKDNAFIMVGVYGETYRGSEIKEIFYSIDAFMSFLDRQEFKKYGYKLVATNLGFDFWGLFYDTEYEHECKPLFRGSSLISAKIKTVDFFDTMNYSRLSVKAQGEFLGLPKLETPAYIIGRRSPDDLELPQIETYCLRDCEVSYKFMKFLQGSFNSLGARTRLTAASTAMDGYRRKYQTYSIRQPSKILRDLMRKAYYGGRTEAFIRGKIRGVYKYDYKSCYPSVMRNPYPDPNFIRVYQHPTEEILAYEGVARCTVRSPTDIEIPFLPYRDEEDDKLLFPVGRWKGWYTHAEIRYARTLGYKICAEFSIYFKRNFYPFETFVNDLYSKRKKMKEEGDPNEFTVKLLMNSLYGKFAQREENWNTCHIDEFDPDDAIEFNIIKNWVSYRKKNQHTPAFVNPILAIYTTAYARIKLYEDFLRCGLKNVYYCDTDSIFTSTELESSTELGELCLEDYIDEGVIIRPKMYMIRAGTKFEYKMKGIQRGTIDIKRDNWHKILKKKRIEYDHFTKFRSALRSKDHHKHGHLKPNQVVVKHKLVNLNDDKRRWPAAFDDKETQTSGPLFISFI